MTDSAEKQWGFIELRAKGNSYDDIAKQLGVSKGTLVRWSRDFNDEVSNYAAIEREKLIESAKLAKHHQIELLGNRLKSIREELDKRDLSDIPTGKLMEAEIKIIETVNRIGVDTVMRVNEDSTFASFTKEVKWIA